MKTKLLKALRKDCEYKFRNGECYVLWKKTNYTFPSIEKMLSEIYRFNSAYHDGPFDWFWDRIYYKQLDKIEKRKFNKI
jgi:hypothetical protein